MTQFEFETASVVQIDSLNQLLTAQEGYPHIHYVDMPYRLASSWHEAGCEVGLWREKGQIVGWALFQPPWWNLDYAVARSYRGTALEEMLFEWGHQQMIQYANRTGDEFWGSVEIFDDDPYFKETELVLESLGFKKFDWHMIRLELDLTNQLTEVVLPDGFKLRPYNPTTDLQAYVELQRAAFDSDNMTTAWRTRMIEQPGYIPELDLIIVNQANEPVGFSVCWLSGEVGQIEPLGVHPATQGIGLGKALEYLSYQKMIQFGAKKLLIDHASFNEKAVQLSLKTGFRQTHNASRYYLEAP
ncbi:MAG: GNAT family N-acetyltransferase [Chloroflexota bacterium]